MTITAMWKRGVKLGMMSVAVGVYGVNDGCLQNESLAEKQRVNEEGETYLKNMIYMFLPLTSTQHLPKCPRGNLHKWHKPGALRFVPSGESKSAPVPASAMVE